MERIGNVVTDDNADNDTPAELQCALYFNIFNAKRL
jgi:hypothetical protein